MAGGGGRSGQVARLVPILGWLPGYDRSWLPFDAIAGLTLWGLLVPEGMAYAGIAGLPPQAGLYTLTVSLLVYALLVAFSEAAGVAHEFAEKHGYEVDTDQELRSHAAVNLGSARVGGMIAAGSMSASAVKESAGARSQVSNLITWAATIVTLLFLVRRIEGTRS